MFDLEKYNSEKNLKKELELICFKITLTYSDTLDYHYLIL